MGNVQATADPQNVLCRAVSEELLKLGYRVRGTTRSASSAKAISDKFQSLYGQDLFEVAEIKDYTLDGAYESSLKGQFNLAVSGCARESELILLSRRPRGGAHSHRLFLLLRHRCGGRELPQIYVRHIGSCSTSFSCQIVRSDIIRCRRFDRFCIWGKHSSIQA